MASKTVDCKVWVGSGGQSVDNHVYSVQDAELVLPAKTTSATVKANVNTSGYLKNFASSTKYIEVYLCDENGSNSVQIFRRAIGAGNTVTDDTTSTSVSLAGLAGKKCYGKFYSDGNSSIKAMNYFRFSVTYNYTPMTAVTKGNLCMVADRSQTGTTTTQGAAMSDTHFTAGTSIEASTFNSQVLGL